MKSLLITLSALFFVISLNAQRTETKKLEFSYVQFPTIPVKGVSNYNTTLLNDYETKIQNMKAAYAQEQSDAESEYQRALRKYNNASRFAEAEYKNATVKYKEDEAIAEAEYQAALKGSQTPKVINKGTSNDTIIVVKRVVPKPVKRQVMRPSKRIVKGLYYPKIFNEGKIKDKYLQLEGMQQDPGNALQLIVTLKGFEQGTTNVQKKKKSTQNQDGNTITTISYIGSIQYKHAVHVQVITPAGQTIMDEIAVGSGNFSNKKTKEFRTWQEADRYMNSSSFLIPLEDQVMRRNMVKLKKALNSRFGYPVKTRITRVRLYSHKKMRYPEYKVGYESLLVAYPKMHDPANRADLLTYSNQAINAWERALKESNPNRKKARINKKVTRFTYLMLAEAYMWTDDFTRAEEYVTKMKVLNPLINERKWLARLETLLASQKQRITAYNNAQ